MIAYSPTRMLNKLVDSQGDGTGTTNQLPEAKTISGATDATPIVVTATSHGYSDGDFVHITGVVGNTACNDLHVVANKTSNTFELNTPAGADVAGNGSYSSDGKAHLCFVCEPAAGEKYCVHRFTVLIQGGNLFKPNFYLDTAALTNGIKVEVRQNTTVVHTLSPAPIKTAPMGWSLGARQLMPMEKVGGCAIQQNWDFSDCAVNLSGDANEFFVVLHSDDMTTTTVEKQLMSLHGESI